MSAFWQPINFETGLDNWIDLEQPEVELRIAVTEWILAVCDDPYAGARRQPVVAPNYWLVKIPRTLHDGHLMVCTFWIDEEARTIRCDNIATLSPPLG